MRTGFLALLLLAACSSGDAGPPGSDLSNPDRYALMTDGQRFQAMKLGVPGTAQQAFGAAMSDDQVWGILAFCASLVDKGGDEATPAEGDPTEAKPAEGEGG